MKPSLKSAIISLLIASPAFAASDDPKQPELPFIPPATKIVFIPSKVKYKNEIPVFDHYSKDHSLVINDDSSDVIELLDILLMGGLKKRQSDYSYRYNMGASKIQGDSNDGVAMRDLVIGIDFFHPSDNKKLLMLEVRRMSGSRWQFSGYYSAIKKALTSI